MSAPAGPDWVPMRLTWTPPALAIDWCHLGDLRFDDPFFVQTIGTAMRHPFNLLFRQASPLDALPAPEIFELRPKGFIFHMSRCGSTVAAQMLAALPCNVVLSEPRPIDQVLRLPGRLPAIEPDRVVRWLRALIAAFARRRRPQERDLFVKFEAWHALLLPLVRRAFPDVPWVFLYRDPLEVLAPLAEQFPAEIDPLVLGLSWPEAAAMSSAAFCTLALERICSAAIAQLGDGGGSGGIAIEYRELPAAAWGRMLAHFGLCYAADDIARMREAARFDAKRPGRLFADDTAAKRRAAGAEVAELAETRLDPLYRQLEALRLSS